MSNIVMLSCVEDKTTRNNHTLPSWVPDYSWRFTEPVVVHSADLKWNACGFCSSPLDSRKLSGRVLELPGALFDTVESISIPLNLSRGGNILSDRAEFARQILTIAFHPGAFPGGVEPRIISLAMTLLVGKTETVTGNFNAEAMENSLLSGVRAKTGLDVFFRAVSVIVFFATSITRHSLSNVVLPSSNKVSCA
jgi:hypothetical protein